MLFNCGVGEESWASLGLKEIQPVHPKGDQSWVFIGRNDVEAETPIFWLPDAQTDSFEKTSMLERLKAGGQGDDKGWDGWMASLTQWTWVWVNSGSWWWTRRPGLLRFTWSQRVGHDWMTELNWLKKVRWASLMAQMVRSSPAVQETWVRSLGCEKHLEKEMAACSSILARRIP